MRSQPKQFKMRYKKALRQGIEFKINIEGRGITYQAYVTANNNSKSDRGNDPMSAIRQALVHWESDPIEDMYFLLQRIANGEVIPSIIIDETITEYKRLR